MFKGTQDNYNSLRVKMIDVKSFYSNENQVIVNLYNCFSLVFLYYGRLSISINGQRHTIYAPAIICLSNRDEVENICLYKNSKTSIVYFDTIFLTKGMSMERVFERDFANIVDQHYFCQLRPFVEKNAGEKCFVLNDILSKHFSRIIEKMKNQLVEQPDFYWPCRTRSCFLEMLVIIESFLYDYKESDKPTAISDEKEEFKKVLEFIISNLNRNIKLEELYKKFFINAQALEKLFKKHLKTTYKQYVKDQRFEMAKNYLRFTKLSLKEIADKVGYSSTQSFNKFFKEKSGTTPIAFRKEQVQARRNDPNLQIK